MAIRLTIISDRHQRGMVLENGEFVVGSSEDADVTIADPTVSRRHARLRVAPDGVHIQDLDSSNGIRSEHGRPLGGKAVAWDAGGTVRLGEVGLQWQRLEAGDEELGLELQPPSPTTGRDSVTLNAVGMDRFTRRHLCRLLESSARDGELTTLARELGEALCDSLPLTGLAIHRGDQVLFAYESIGEKALLQRRGELEVALQFGEDQLPASFEPMARVALAFLETARERQLPERETAPIELPLPATVDQAMRRIYSQAARAAEGQLNILIRGESGTGKEVLARFIHARLEGQQAPFVALNCAALPENLLEAELFGIEKGVATGVTERAGKFELADGGILFLDEIGDMPLSTQARILRVLQEGEVVRIGASQPRRIQVQVVAASHQDIDAMVERGEFRLDLFHRLSDWELRLPSLRERTADIPNLALFFLARSARELGRPVRGLSRRAVDLLLSYRWPGNVRELEREMKRVAAFADPDQLITGADLSPRLRRGEASPRGTSLRERLEQEEKHIIEAVLVRHDGNVSAAAKELDVGRSTLYRHLERLGIEAPERD